MTLRIAPLGPPAVAALRDAVEHGKGGDPLAPVTVLVRSPWVGLWLRRSRLGGPALVNVRFLTMSRLAELLGAPLLAAAGGRPLTAPRRLETARALLAQDPGPYSPEIAAQPATAAAVSGALASLRRARAAAMAEVARAGRQGRHLASLLAKLARAVGSRYDEHALAFAAAAGVDDGRVAAALADVGRAVLFCPPPLAAGDQALVEALARAGRLSAVVGVSGDETADGPALAAAAALERMLGPVVPPGAGPPVGTQVVVAPDAECEVRWVVQEVAALAAAGVRLPSIAVLYAMGMEPYARLAHEHLEAAGVPHAGPGAGTLADSAAGRTLVGALGLPAARYSRRAVMGWLAAAPVVDANGRRPPVARWEALARDAGVTAGAGEWGRRLRQHRNRAPATAGSCDALGGFVAELIRSTAPPSSATWSERARWAVSFLEQRLAGGAVLDEEERVAYDKVIAAVAGLGELDDVAASVTPGVFAAAVAEALRGPGARFGTFGAGVFLGPLAEAGGAQVDTVFVLGLAEGSLPSTMGDDAALPERVRAAAGLGGRAQRAAEERWTYLGALAGGGRRVLLTPRADLRAGQQRLPSRWLLETASALAGRRVGAAELWSARSDWPWLTVVPSFESLVCGDGLAGSVQEHELRSLAAGGAVGGPEVAAGLACARARAGASLTPWDGLVSAAPSLRAATRGAASATRLERWAECPRRFLLGDVLGVGETVDPDAVVDIDAADRGMLVHRALERFFGEAAPRAGPTDPWTEAERARLREIVAEVCDEGERGAVIGQPLLWRLERRRLERHLAALLDVDERYRAEEGVVPLAHEARFGRDGDPLAPVVVAVREGEVRFAGRIDRLDRSPGGDRLVVTDYKSGRSVKRRLPDGGPDVEGVRLQLPLYAMAGGAAEPGARVTAAYWFVTDGPGYGRQSVEVDAEMEERLAEAVGRIVEGVESGLFPANPGGEDGRGGWSNCRHCPFDRVCPADRQEAWDRKAADPAMAPYLGEARA